MIHEIPATFRDNANRVAERRLAGITDSAKARLIINQIAEEEWALDRIEWRQWMDRMKAKSYQMFATPQERVNYEQRRPNCHRRP